MLRLQGVKEAVQCVVFSPDGKTLASTGSDRYIRIREQGTGKPLALWKAEDYAILALAFAPDGKTLAAGCFNRSIRIWDIATQKEVEGLVAGQPTISALAFSPDGKTLAGSFGDRLKSDAGGGVALWDTTTWKMKDALRCPQGKQTPSLLSSGEWVEKGVKASTAKFGCVQDVRWSRDGKSLLLATGMGGVVLWDIAGKKPRAVFEQANARSADLAPNGSFIAAADSTRINLFDTGTGEKRELPKSHRKMVWSVAVSPDSKWVLSGAKDGIVCLWEASSGRLLASYDWGIGTVHHVCFAPDGMTAAVGGHEGTVVVWDVDPSDMTGRTDTAGQAYPTDYVPTQRAGPMKLDHKKEIQEVVFSSDGQMVAAVAQKNYARIWNALSGKELARMPKTTHCRTAQTLTFTPDGRFLIAAGTKGGFLFVWDVQAGKEAAIFTAEDFTPPGKQPIFLHCWSLAVSPDSKQVFCGIVRNYEKKGSAIELLHAEKAGLKVTVLKQEGNGCGLAFSPDGRNLAVCTSGRRTELFLWDPQTQQRHEVAFALPDASSNLYWSADGKRLAASTYKSGVFVFDTETGAILHQLPRPHKTGTASMSLSPDGTLVLTSGVDRTVRLWDVASGQQKAQWEWELGKVRSVAFGPDGKSAVCGTERGVAVVWDLDPKLLTSAK
jgi:WD40 repeat protein